MLLIRPEFFKLPKHLVRVWRNEFQRVFCDRLNSEQVNIIFEISFTVFKTKKKQIYKKNILVLVRNVIYLFSLKS